MPSQADHKQQHVKDNGRNSCCGSLVKFNIKKM